MVVATVWPGQRDSSEGGWVAVLLQNIQKWHWKSPWILGPSYSSEEIRIN
jgi:hypothetical protein